MDHDVQQQPGTGGQVDRDAIECAGCAGAVRGDPSKAGLNCVRCGQWHVLCDDCMPNVSEHSRDAAWMCPDCQAKRPDA